MRRLSTSTLIVAAVIMLAAPARSDPANSQPGLKLLGPSSLVVAFRLGPAYDLLDELRKGLTGSASLVLTMARTGLGQMLGFDPTTRSWIEKAGIDETTPVLGSIAIPDLAGVRAYGRRLEAAAQKAIATRASGGSARVEPAPGPVPLTQNRFVLRLKDPAKLRSFLASIAVPGRSPVLLEGRSKSEAATLIRPMLGADDDAAAIAEALLASRALACFRLDTQNLAVLRVEESFAVLDLIGTWAQTKRDPGFAKALASSLAIPKRPSIELRGIAARAFTDDASLALLVRAKPTLQVAELAQEQLVLRSAAWVKDKAAFGKDRKAARTCVASFRKVPSGDLALQIVVSKTAVRGKAFWAAPPALVKLIQGSAAKQDLIDPTAWQSKAVAFAGSTLALGPLSASLARGPFKAGVDGLQRSLSDCRMVAPQMLLLGGWTGLLGALHTEGARTPLFKLVLGQLQNGVVVLRELYSLRSPLFLAHLVVGPKLPHARLKEEVAKIYPETQGKPQELTVGGRTATLYRFLKAPLSGLSGAVTDLKAAGSSITLSSRPWDLQWLLSQILGETATPLPRSILFFAHAKLGTILAAAAREARGAEGAALKTLAGRVDTLGANLGLQDGVITADLDLALK